jgi:hypothetical protein
MRDYRRSSRLETRTRLGIPGPRPAYEEVLQDIFAIRRGERLSANLTMQQPIVGA